VGRRAADAVAALNAGNAPADQLGRLLLDAGPRVSVDVAVATWRRLVASGGMPSSTEEIVDVQFEDRGAVIVARHPAWHNPARDLWLRTTASVGPSATA
jgi:hypothetical protein